MKIIFLLLTATLVMVVAVRGRGTERLTAAVFVLASVASPLVENSGFVGLEIYIMLVDALVLIFLIAVAVRSDRFWPLWAAGFQLVDVSIHAARMMKSDVWFFAYSNAEIFWSYPVYLALIIGTVAEAGRPGR